MRTSKRVMRDSIAARVRRGAAGVVAAVVTLGVTPRSACADESECAVKDIQYDVSANLKVTDTPMGAGDGVYHVGPGTVVLRFDERPERRAVKLLAYGLRQNFTVVAKALFWATRVTTAVELRAGSGSRTPVAEGRLVNHTLSWNGSVDAVRSDGTLTCEGSMCGKFGAPRSGKSEVHTGPTSLELKPFEFGADRSTFTMGFALLSASDAPKQRTLVAMAGREVRRACVPLGSED
jgi:hypothetical protein